MNSQSPIRGSRIFFLVVGGGGGGLPDNNPDIFLVLNFNILHFTVIERRSRIRVCPHSSKRLILGGGVLIYFYTYFAKSGSAAILKHLASSKMRVPAPKLGVQDCQSAVSESSDDAMFLHIFVSSQLMGAQWISGRVVEPRLRAAAGSNLTGVTCVMSLSKNINPSLVLVQPRKIRT